MFYKIGWLDSCRMPSHVHKTEDGNTTLCGHNIKENNRLYGSKIDPSPRWLISIVPTKYRGQSRYCRKCFATGKKSIPWWK